MKKDKLVWKSGSILHFNISLVGLFAIIVLIFIAGGDFVG